jgi:hypothetical protein
LVPFFGKGSNGRLGINSYWMKETEDALKTPVANFKDMNRPPAVMPLSAKANFLSSDGVVI